MKWWDKRAGEVFEKVKEDEIRQRGGGFYDQGHINQAIVHTRDDMVLLVGHMSSSIHMLSAIRNTIRWVFWAIVVLIFVVAKGS